MSQPTKEAGKLLSPNLRSTRLSGGAGVTNSFVKVKEVVLNYNAALSFQPLGLAPGDLVVSIDAEVTSTFNAVGETVAVGVVGTPNRYFAPGAINLNALATTSVLALDQITLASQVLISFVRGTGGTQGQVRFVIRYVPQAQTVTVPVLVSIAVTPATPTLNGGGVVQAFTATGTFSDLSTQDITTQCVWASTVPGAATIVAGTGVATTTGGGATIISATQGAISGNTTLNVTAVLVSIAVSPLVPLFPNIIVPTGTQQYKAIGTFSDASFSDITATSVWSTTTPGLVSVGATGLVTAIANGAGNVRAVKSTITGNAVQNVKTVASTDWIRPDGTVTAALTAPSTLAGYNLQFRVTYTDASTSVVDDWVTFGTSNAAVLTMAAGGFLTGVAPGAANAEATYFGVLYTLPVTIKTLSSLALTFPFAQMPQQRVMTGSVTATFTDLSTTNATDMVVLSSDDGIIAVSGNGQIFSGILAGNSPAAAEDANIDASIGAIFSPSVLISVGEVIGGLVLVMDVNPVLIGGTTVASSSGSYNGIVGVFDLTSFTDFTSIGPNLTNGPVTGTYIGAIAGFQNVDGAILQGNPFASPALGSVPVTVL